MGVCAPWKKFGQKMKNFEIFFDIIDNHICAHMHIKKFFKIFHFSAKFLNYLKGPSTDYFKIECNYLFEVHINSENWKSSRSLKFGLAHTIRMNCVHTFNISLVLLWVPFDIFSIFNNAQSPISSCAPNSLEIVCK